MQSATHESVFASGLRFHVVRAGEGPAVLLLHGFPDFWFTWRYQIPALAAAGFSAVAPDLRGYGGTDKPAGVAAYDIDFLVADVAGIVHAACGGRAHLVGHDWGGIIAWHAAAAHPELFESLVVLNAPHPCAYARDLWRTRQWLRSWYAYLFQVPWLPEAAIRARHFRVLEETCSREVANRDAFAHGEIDEYKGAFAEPGALESAINYYRAAFRRVLARGASPIAPVDTPTLLLWGERDTHLETTLTEGLEPWVRHLTVRRFPNAGHWLQLDEPETVSRAIIEWCSR